jgi:predicted ester cyclase
MNFGKQYQNARPVLRHIVSVWRTAFPDLRFTTGKIIAEEDTVMCEMLLEGTHLGEFTLIPPLQGPRCRPTARASG